MPNVNIELFKRTSPERKIELIRKLTQAELSGISESTLLRIVKETGRRIKGSRKLKKNLSSEIVIIFLILLVMIL